MEVQTCNLDTAEWTTEFRTNALGIRLMTKFGAITISEDETGVSISTLGDRIHIAPEASNRVVVRPHRSRDGHAFGEAI